MAKNVKNNQHSATNNEILAAVNDFAGQVDDRFAKVDDRFAKVDDRFAKIDGHFAKIEKEMATKSDLAKLETRLVTKDYLDDKLADLRGDLVVLTRKEDNKLKTLVGVLAEKKVLDRKDVKRIYALEPFAQQYL